MRSVALLVALLVVLACTVSVSASSVSDWSVPSTELWDSAALSASELEARHTEFLMADASSSSTGETFVPPVDQVASSSAPANGIEASSAAVESSTAAPELPPVSASVELGCIGGECGALNATSLKSMFADSFGVPDARYPGEAIDVVLESSNFTIADPSSSASEVASSTGAAAVAVESSSAAAPAPVAARRLLSVVETTKASFILTPSPVDQGVHVNQMYAAFVQSLRCTDTAEQTKSECLDKISTEYSLPRKLSEDPTFAALSAAVIPGSLAVSNPDAANAGPLGANNVETEGGPRRTNIGYYVLGAILVLFIVLALIYFIVHKKPVETVNKSEPLRRDEVALAPVVAAPAAQNSGVVVAEDAPLANQQQMDYRSVFALKHNVLDKSAEQKAQEDDEHNHNDVHFILHQ